MSEFLLCMYFFYLDSNQVHPPRPSPFPLEAHAGAANEQGRPRSPADHQQYRVPSKGLFGLVGLWIGPEKVNLVGMPDKKFAIYQYWYKVNEGKHKENLMDPYSLPRDVPTTHVFLRPPPRPSESWYTTCPAPVTSSSGSGEKPRVVEFLHVQQQQQQQQQQVMQQ